MKRKTILFWSVIVLLAFGIVGFGYTNGTMWWATDDEGLVVYTGPFDFHDQPAKLFLFIMDAAADDTLGAPADPVDHITVTITTANGDTVSAVAIEVDPGGGGEVDGLFKVYCIGGTLPGGATRYDFAESATNTGGTKIDAFPGGWVKAGYNGYTPA